MSRGAKAGIVGTVATGMFVVAGFGAYNIYSSLDGGHGGSGGQSPLAANSPISSAPPTAKEVTDAADAFLTAWSSGDTTKAGSLTDSPLTAAGALTTYKEQAHLTSVQIKPGVVAGTSVPYTINAHISFDGISTAWTYGSSLKVVRSTGNKVVVKWAPTVVNPHLTEGDTIVTGRAKAPEVEIVDRNGKVMTAAQYPSLTQIIPYLGTQYGSTLKHPGTPGIETYIEDNGGTQTETLKVLRKGTSAKLRTTLDAGAQAAAEKAVKTRASSGVTALDTRTGGVLAVAFHPATGQNIAFNVRQAPGSTFKIVTATALLKSGLTPHSPAKCISGSNVANGKPYTNVTRDKPSATLDWDFAQSCNTGFIQLAGRLDTGTLGQVGEDYYGLGKTWWIGTPTSDGQIPGGTGDEKTSEMIGQGQVLMTTLNMASVSATVRDGQFHQPSILQDSSVIPKRSTISTLPLPYSVRDGLMQMMHDTVTTGTAYPDMHNFGGTVGAKTGSAELSTGEPNGWFTAYHGNVAAAGLVLAGGHGNTSAGPIVASVLSAVS
jgi:hypothetical protein